MRKIFLVGIDRELRGFDRFPWIGQSARSFPVGYSYPGNHLQTAAVRHDL